LLQFKFEIDLLTFIIKARMYVMHHTSCPSSTTKLKTEPATVGSFIKSVSMHKQGN